MFMKKFFTIFFVTLGIIFFLIICAGVYLYVADPFEIRPLIDGLRMTSEQTEQTTETTDTPEQTATNTTDKNPLLSASQEQALEKVGIDPAALPTEISPEMEACAYQKLGEKRAEELKNGAAPTINDYFAARSCL